MDNSLFGYLFALGMFFVIFLLITIISFWVLYNKAGKPGWSSIVPFYNIVVFLQISGRPVWWIIFFILPFIGLAFLFMFLDSTAVSAIYTFTAIASTAIYLIVLYDFIKAYDKRGLSLALFFIFGIFLPMISFPILAFSKSTRYIGRTAAEVGAEEVK